MRIDATLQQMEASALEAYRKDIENNADLTAENIKKKLEDTNSVLSGGKKVWKELKSEEGHSYYWNTLTNGSNLKEFNFICCLSNIFKSQRGNPLKKAL